MSVTVIVAPPPPSRDEELHRVHEARREYCENCPMIRKMVEDEEKLRVRLLALEVRACMHPPSVHFHGSALAVVV